MSEDAGQPRAPRPRKKATVKAARGTTAAASEIDKQAQGLGDIVRNHPLVVIVSIVASIVAAIMAGAWGLLGFVDAAVNKAVNTQIAAMRSGLVQTINERAKMTRLYAIDPNGNRTGQLSDLIEAADDGRSIFVRYTREGDLPDGRPYRSEWFRACDGFSLDYVDRVEILTCFILRLPDTDILETGRVVKDPTAFEDYSISTEGVARWRKYTVADGTIYEEPTAFEADGTDIQWWAAPAPLTVSEN